MGLQWNEHSIAHFGVKFKHFLQGEGILMRKSWPWIATAAAFLWCLFIWQFSFRDGSTSSATSAAVLKIVNGFFETFGIKDLFTPHAIRKTGHFCEFMMLGVLACAALRLHGFRHFYLIAPGVAFCVGGVDEIIQSFVPNRGPSFLDVLLDTAGGITGILLFCLALWAFSAWRGRRAAKKAEKT